MDRTDAGEPWHERGSAAGSSRGRAAGYGTQGPVEGIAVFVVRRHAIWRGRRGAGRGPGNLVGAADGVVFRIARSHEIVAHRISLGGCPAKLFRGAVHGGAEF